MAERDADSPPEVIVVQISPREGLAMLNARLVSFPLSHATSVPTKAVTESSTSDGPTDSRDGLRPTRRSPMENPPASHGPSSPNHPKHSPGPVSMVPVNAPAIRISATHRESLITATTALDKWAGHCISSMRVNASFRCQPTK